MDIKLIVFDLDDTLLRDDLTISERCREAVGRARARGIRVALASGRMARSAAKYHELLGLDTPIITCNGATVYDKPGGEMIYSRPVDVNAAREACAWAEGEGRYIQAYLGDDYYFESTCAYSDLYHRFSGVKGLPLGGPLSERLDQPPHKLLIIDEKEAIPGIYQSIKARFGDELALAISKPIYVECTHPDANKGSALLAVLERLGIAPEHVMAVGDSLNDIPMFGVAGLSVAMGNAREETKRAATYVTLSNEEDGAALAIERYALGEGA